MLVTARQTSSTSIVDLNIMIYSAASAHWHNSYCSALLAPRQYFAFHGDSFQDNDSLPFPNNRCYIERGISNALELHTTCIT